MSFFRYGQNDELGHDPENMPHMFQLISDPAIPDRLLSSRACFRFTGQHKLCVQEQTVKPLLFIRLSNAFWCLYLCGIINITRSHIVQRRVNPIMVVVINGILDQRFGQFLALNDAFQPILILDCLEEAFYFGIIIAVIFAGKTNFQPIL